MSYQGYIDELTDSSVMGWVVNEMYPNDIVYVYVKTNLRILKIQPTIHRLDVQHLYFNNGMNGFLMHLDNNNKLNFRKEKGIEYILGVYFQNGMVIPGQPLDLDRMLRKEKIKYFIHIQKTAGTALRDSFNKSIRADKILYIYPSAPGILPQHYEMIPENQVQGLSLVFGH
ncbi:MAG: hypothetical protein Q8M09_18825, partial [Pseudomonadota bacterium]|nr:hypothetical protein [Pseudomonadota bacterium]